MRLDVIRPVSGHHDRAAKPRLGQPFQRMVQQGHAAHRAEWLGRPCLPKPAALSGRQQDCSPDHAAASAMNASTALNALSSGICRSEEHTSELQSLMRISYAVFCLKKKNKTKE